MRRISVQILVGLFLVISQLFVFSIFTASAAQPLITLNLEPGALADVRPGESGEAIINGTASLTLRGPGQNVQDVILYLQSHSDHDWQSGVNPNQIVFEARGETTKDFKVSVFAPPETSSSLTDTVTVSGNVRSNPGALVYNIEPASETVSIVSYLRFDLSTEEKEQTLVPGDDFSFRFAIVNYGNYNETFNLVIGSDSDEEIKKWEIKFSEDPITVEPFSYGNLTLKGKIPVRESIGRYNIKIIVTSNGIDGNDGTVLTKELSYWIEISKGGPFVGSYSFYGLIIILVIVVAVVFSKRNIIVTKYRNRRLRKAGLNYS